MFGQPLLPTEWLQTIHSTFKPTVVHEAFLSESPPQSWRVVAVRITPCAPLAHTLHHDLSTLCWPEIRLVWQPVFHEFEVAGTIHTAYADDRAVHVLYRFVPTHMR